ncbi:MULTISPECIES: LysE family translocator [unclassified Brevundimonas]|uniref:LysE family translocator n=1 Tax=unclassified Brevundimonas TaxID=2622653 RepID=UPI0025B978C5|nr:MULTISPECIES: LysE family translocator [unclassified Brevundimonas]
MTSLPVDPHLYVAYLGAMAVMAFTPGPANVFAIATGMQRGKGAALLAVAGMNLATLTWFGAAALGLGAMVKAFPAVFKIIAVGGAVYVAWLGLKSLLKALKPENGNLAAARLDQKRSPVFDGFLVQIANPKAILFFTAVLPPFLDLARPIGAQLVLFGAGTIGFDIIAMCCYGLGGAAIARMMVKPAFRRGFDIAVGVLLLLAAGLIASRL